MIIRRGSSQAGARRPPIRKNGDSYIDVHVNRALPATAHIASSEATLADARNGQPEETRMGRAGTQVLRVLRVPGSQGAGSTGPRVFRVQATGSDRR